MAVAPPSPETAGELLRQVETALREDIGDGDLCAAPLSPTTTARARIIAKTPGVLAGAPWVDAVFARLNEQISVEWRLQDGDAFTAGDELCEIRGDARALLAGERCALNFLQTLSATATSTAQFVRRARPAVVRDTRKTLPGLRLAQKYAVQCGGGANHRVGLYDAALIKENHIAACGSIQAAVAGVRKAHPGAPIEVEVRTRAQIEEVLALRDDVDCILFDNFSLDDIRRAVRTVDGRMKTEASGGVDLDSVAAIAATGVDYIAIGGLTKNIAAPDLSMQIIAD